MTGQERLGRDLTKDLSGLGGDIAAFRTAQQAYQRQAESVGGIIGGTTANNAITSSSAALGGASDSLADFTASAAGATSGIGILKRTGSGVLKAEIQALEKRGLGKTISNPKVFTLDNQVATVTQGEEIPYQTTSDGTTSTSFKEAALKLEVTPSIIGDGNVLLSIKVNNDTPNRAAESDEPPINKMEIVTKLLVADGDIVDTGALTRERMKTVDREFKLAALDFMTRAVDQGKPFFVWLSHSSWLQVLA